MHVILEGCDGTGKTTLAKLLAEKYGLDICHCTQHDPKDFEFYKQTARKENVVWDRHAIGELIYPNVFGRTAEISVEDAKIILSYARENGGKVLVITADDDVIASRLHKRGGEDNSILEKLSWINYQFRFYANCFGLPLIDTSQMTMDEIFKLIEMPDDFKFIHK